MAYFGPPAGLLDHLRAAAEPPPRRQRATTQVAVLVRCYAEVVLADRQYVAFLAALPFALSVLARVVPAPYGLGAPAAGHRNHQAVQVLLVLVISGALMGTATAVRELVKEREVYRRERSVGLSPVAYLASKAGVLTAVVTVQSVVLVGLSLVGRALPARGLAMPLMVLLVMVQIVFAGALFPVHGRFALAQLSWLSPSRWGFAALAGTSDLRHLAAGSDLVDPLWARGARAWWEGACAQVGITVVALVVGGLRLRRLDPRAR